MWHDPSGHLYKEHMCWYMLGSSLKKKKKNSGSRLRKGCAFPFHQRDPKMLVAVPTHLVLLDSRHALLTAFFFLSKPSGYHLDNRVHGSFFIVIVTLLCINAERHPNVCVWCFFIFKGHFSTSD